MNRVYSLLLSIRLERGSLRVVQTRLLRCTLSRARRWGGLLSNAMQAVYKKTDTSNSRPHFGPDKCMV